MLVGYLNLLFWGISGNQRSDSFYVCPVIIFVNTDLKSDDTSKLDLNQAVTLTNTFTHFRAQPIYYNSIFVVCHQYGVHVPRFWHICLCKPVYRIWLHLLITSIRLRVLNSSLPIAEKYSAYWTGSNTYHNVEFIQGWAVLSPSGSYRRQQVWAVPVKCLYQCTIVKGKFISLISKQSK